MLELGLVLIAAALGLAVGWFGWIVSAALLGLLVIFYFSAKPVRLLILLIVLIAVGQFGRIPPGSASGALLLADVVAGALFLLWMVWAIARKPAHPLEGQAPRAWNPALVAWLGFLGIALLTLLFTPLAIGKRELATNASYLLRLLFYSSLVWIVPALLPGREGGMRLLRWLVGAVVAVMLLGFVQLYLLPNIGVLAKYGWDPHVGRLVSSFLDPNYLGGFFAVSIALLGSLLPHMRRRKDAVLLGIVLALFLGASVLTFSRSGYLAVGIVVLILGLRYSWRILLLAVLCVTPLALSIPRVQQRVAGGFSVDATSVDRIQSWEKAAAIISSYPALGIGYNNYRTAQEEMGDLSAGSTSRSGAGSDSSLLNVFATTGFFGLCLFLTALFLMLRQALAILRARPEDGREGRPGFWQPIAALTLLVSAPALFVHTWFVNGLFYPFILLILSLLIALLYIRPAAPKP